MEVQMKRAARLAVYTFFLSFAVSAAGCSGISYNDDFDPTIDFSSFQTFAWLQPSGDETASKRGVDEFTEKRIINAIEEELRAKGLEPAGSGTPDFLVNFYVTTQQKIDVSTYYTGWGYYGWYGGGTQTYVNQWTEGSLIVDFVEFKDKDLAWRGWAKAAIESDLNSQQRTQRINDVIAGIMKRFPPQ